MGTELANSEKIKMSKDDPSIKELFQINYDAGYQKGFDDGVRHIITSLKNFIKSEGEQ